MLAVPQGSSLAVLPRSIWGDFFNQVFTGVHAADRWVVDGLSKPPTIKEVRELKDFASRTATGEYKVAVVGAADQLRIEAANALLKLLEEPPAFLRIVLVSESPHVLPTIASRVSRLDVHEVESSSFDTEVDRSAFQSWKDYLESLPIAEPGARAEAEQMLYYQRLLHSTIQHRVVLEGFRNDTP